MIMGIRKTSEQEPQAETSPGPSPRHIGDYLEDSNKIAEPATKSPLRRRDKKFNTYRFCKRDERRKTHGARQARRNDNLKGLLNQFEQDTTSELDDQDYMSVQEPTFSAFAALFLEQEKMRIWNDFVNHTEEDQTKILSGLKELSIGDDSDDDMEIFSGTDTADTIESTKDKRKVHPGFTAEECFMRIDQKLRIFLKKQHLPKGVMKNMEEELTNFFVEWPTSIYISHAASSFDRMLVHALSQYLDLISKSYDTDDGSRHTQVENRHMDFRPPQTGLTDYLEYKHSKH